LFEKAEDEFSINLLGGLYEVITKGYRSVNIEFVYLSLFSHSRKKRQYLPISHQYSILRSMRKTMPTAFRAVKAMQEDPTVYIFCTSIGDSDSEIQSEKSPGRNAVQ
jgi:hypothetical protein